MSITSEQRSDELTTVAHSRIDASDFITRAQRFPIQMPVYCRVRGDPRWREGKSINISRTGVLFQTQSILAPNTMLIVCIVLPAEPASGSRSSVFCWGMVVRSESDGHVDKQPSVAAAISHYRFSRQRLQEMPTGLLLHDVLVEAESLA